MLICEEDFTTMVESMRGNLSESSMIVQQASYVRTARLQDTRPQNYGAVFVSKLKSHFIVLVLHFMLYFSNLM